MYVDIAIDCTKSVELHVFDSVASSVGLLGYPCTNKVSTLSSGHSMVINCNVFFTLLELSHYNWASGKMGIPYGLYCSFKIDMVHGEPFDIFR